MTTRLIQDALTRVSKAFAAAGANNSSDSIDLGNVTPGVAMEQVQLAIEVPILPILVEAKTIIFTVQDSADDSDFAAIAELATYTVTGETGDGVAAASTHVVRLPPSTRRYVRVNAAVLTAGGDNTNQSYVVTLRY